MNKTLRNVLIGIASLVVILMLLFWGFRNYTKSHSPEETASFSEGDLKIEVFYNRPSKKGRIIFGELVPYDVVWRTGANEATTFTSNKDLTIGGEVLKAGTYTLWTIPGQNEWKVIFNSEMYPWGVDFNADASRKAEFDVLTTSVAVESLSQSLEMFTIDFAYQEVLNMTLAWDQTKVSVPITW
ncbi:MAG: DUF2911 domain-containing protein [Bacteroidia bacterium]|nr:DUF2911 domain-containing protein [Bacteroidia bacterium]